MSDKNLRQQVILSAVDKFTRPFQTAAASVKKLSAALQHCRSRLKELNTQVGRINGFPRAGTLQIRQLEQLQRCLMVLNYRYRDLHQSELMQRIVLKAEVLDTRSLRSAQRQLIQRTGVVVQNEGPITKFDVHGSEQEALQRQASRTWQNNAQDAKVTVQHIVEKIDVQLKGARSETLPTVPAAMQQRSMYTNGVDVLTNTLPTLIGPLAMLSPGINRLEGGLMRIAAEFAWVGLILASVTARFGLLADAMNVMFRHLAADGATKAAEAIKRQQKTSNAQEEVQTGGGILSALRDGAMGAITDQAQKAMNLLILAFTNPAAAIRELNVLLAGLRTSFGFIGAVVSALGSGIGGVFASLSGAINSAGGMISWLVSGPFVMLRLAWTGLSALVLALFTPIGGVIAALVAAGVAIWKFWEPINAFIGGVVEGFSAAVAPIMAIFAPLKPMFQSIGGSLKELWGWFIQILEPVKLTAEALDNAAAMGSQFGKILGGALNSLMKPLLIVHDSLERLLEKFGLVGKKTEEVKLPAEAAKKTYALTDPDNNVLPETAGWWYPGAPLPVYDGGGTIQRGRFGIVGERGPEIVSGPANIISRRRTAALASLVAASMGAAAAPAEWVPLHPMSLAVMERAALPETQVSTPAAVHIETHAPITIYAQPGQDAQDIAREVARQLDEREHQALARVRSNYSDRGGYES